MKIMHFHWRYGEYGGGEQYLNDLCTGLESFGHQVVVVTASDQINYPCPPQRQVYYIGGSFGLKSGLRMWNRVREILNYEDPDVIHLHETLCFLSPLIINRLMRMKPVVQTLHTAFFFARLVLRFYLPRPYAIILWESSAY